MRHVIKGLNKEPQDRSKADIETLIEYFSGVKAFKDLKISYADFAKIIYAIKCQFVPKHEVLFRYGDRGTTFYVCLSGQCQLFILNPELRALKNQKRDLEEKLEIRSQQLKDLQMQAPSIQMSIKVGSKLTEVKRIQYEIEQNIEKQ